MTLPNVVILPAFTLNICGAEYGDDGIHYDFALCAGTPVSGSQSTLVEGTVIYDADADRFTVDRDNLRHPRSMRSDDAEAVIAAMFEESGRGAKYDGDWSWTPLDLDSFIDRRFYSPQKQRIARALGR